MTFFIKERNRYVVLINQHKTQILCPMPLPKIEKNPLSKSEKNVFFSLFGNGMKSEKDHFFQFSAKAPRVP
jgi:hypothetical protein